MQCARDKCQGEINSVLDARDAIPFPFFSFRQKTDIAADINQLLILHE